MAVTRSRIRASRHPLGDGIPPDRLISYYVIIATAGHDTTSSFFEELLARVDHLELNGEPERSATVFVGGLKHLPVSYRVS